jgi:hypothetical protein
MAYKIVLQAFDPKTKKKLSGPQTFHVIGNIADAANDIIKTNKWPAATLLSIEELETA